MHFLIFILRSLGSLLLVASPLLMIHNFNRMLDSDTVRGFLTFAVLFLASFVGVFMLWLIVFAASVLPFTHF
jgi:hypothetical protein